MTERKAIQWCDLQSPESQYELLMKILSRYPFSIQNEILCQNGIEQKLKLHGVPYEREVVLGKFGTIDFVVAGTVGIEIKIKGQRMPVYRQCVRYCKSGIIHKLLLATMHPLSLPSEIEGIPAEVVSMASAQLKRLF